MIRKHANVHIALLYCCVIVVAAAIITYCSVPSGEASASASRPAPPHALSAPQRTVNRHIITFFSRQVPSAESATHGFPQPSLAILMQPGGQANDTQLCNHNSLDEYGFMFQPTIRSQVARCIIVQRVSFGVSSDPGYAFATGQCQSQPGCGSLACPAGANPLLTAHILRTW